MNEYGNNKGSYYWDNSISKQKDRTELHSTEEKKSITVVDPTLNIR